MPMLAAFSTRFCVGILCALILSAQTRADTLADYKQLTLAGYLLETPSGHVIAESSADQPLVPASTVKLLTALLCLQYWGEDHRFNTRFYFDASQSRLWVRAGGDPFLVSEEIVLIARALVQRGITNVNSIGLDVSLFSADLVVPGATTTDNPYDAVPTALAANFNTVNIQKSGGSVLSGELQTPVTPLARSIGKALAEGDNKRVNLGVGSKVAERYFAELLAQMLRHEGVKVKETVLWGNAPKEPALYTHSNTRTLGEVLQGMLKYSTNFIANQLLLTLVAEQSSEPASFELMQEFLDSTLRAQFEWAEFTLLEGAGLSEKNRLSARQLVEVVKRIQPWRHLLPEVAPGVVAKTGTLSGVKTLAGYAKNSEYQWLPFAVLINETVDHDFPLKTIQSLLVQEL